MPDVYHTERDSRTIRLLLFACVVFAVLAAALATVGTASGFTTASSPVALPSHGCVTPGCSIRLSTSSGSHGNKVKVTMKGFYANDFGQVWFWNGVTGSTAALVASGSTGSTGNFALSFFVPTETVGHYVVFVTDFTGDNQSAPFNLTHVALSPRSGTVSSNFHMGVMGFLGTTTIKVTIDGVTVGAVAPCRTNGHGDFSLSSCILYVPNLSPGTYQLVATDGTNFARTQFTVT